MYEQREIIGGFYDFDYWSSTEYTYDTAMRQYLGDSFVQLQNQKVVGNFVRAIRAF